MSIPTLPYGLTAAGEPVQLFRLANAAGMEVEIINYGATVTTIRVPDRDVRLARFSVNSIAFFGSDIARIGEAFFPPQRDEEEWFSAVLPARFDTCGRILGDLIVSHFGFYTQERELLQTDILDAYYGLASLPVPAYEKPVDRKRLKDVLRPWRKPAKKGWPEPEYSVSLRERAPA